MKNDRSEPAMVWTAEGVWLQTFDDQGQMRLSGCGQISLESVKFFCKTRGLQLTIVEAGRRTVRYHPVIT